MNPFARVSGALVIAKLLVFRRHLDRSWLAPRAVLLVCAMIAAPMPLLGLTVSDAWLQYASVEHSAGRALPQSVVPLDASAVAKTAAAELARGVRGMLQENLRDMPSAAHLFENDAIVLGTAEEIYSRFPGLAMRSIGPDGFWLGKRHLHGHTYLIIAGGNDRGILYGAFALLRRVAQGQSTANLDDLENPSASIRWADQWDNLDGSIERGYAGPSIFFAGGMVRADLTRVSEYARLLASVGINGCNIDNVNADPRTLTADFLPQLARVADAMRPWGVRLALSVSISSPKIIGGLDTFDPLDPRVIAWWRDKADEIYKVIPDFAGFTIKADSEGQPGPSSFGRTPADAANSIARALAPHGGVLLYRTFVYNHHLDWRDAKNDRARSAYDIFHPLDGKFDDNVVLQIKHGPIDFQAREPVSPLIGGLARTNEAIELQVTQEYTGQQRHLCFLVPMWKQALDLDMHAASGPTLVRDIVSGKIFHRPHAGFVAVLNVGLDENWLAHPLAMANLYGFGRLAWNPELSSADIAEEWTRLTFGNDPLVVRTVSEMQLSSWHIYESYTGPLGAGTMTDIIGIHYGPGIESSERNGWGQWHRSDHDGIGMDRTVATGTGYIGQYNRPLRVRYGSLALCPDELLLFMHHVLYTHKLHSGKTVIQHIYDSHYEGAEAAARLVTQWKSLRGYVDVERYTDVLARLEYQQGHAIVWRDAICEWFLRISGIPDEQGRAGHHPGRIEAESIQLDGYVVVDVTPWETASGAKAVACSRPSRCSASTRFDGAAGTHSISVEYFDQNSGVAAFHLYVNGKLVDEWRADASLPSARMDGHTSTRHTSNKVELHPGDTIRVDGVPDRGDQAGIDYVEIR